jgi:predicted transposase/invertase (TIGR01784 family)
MNEFERVAYQLHQKELHHEASLYESTFVLGKLEGIDDGIEKGILLTAKNMKQLGIDIHVIAQATGLPIAQLTDL